MSPSPRQRGFTLTELLVVLVITAVLAALAASAWVSVLKSSRAAECLANLRSLGTAFQLYANDHDGDLPPPSYDAADPKAYWRLAVLRYAGVDIDEPGAVYRSPFRCPDVAALIESNGGNPGLSSFAMNYYLSRENTKGLNGVRVAGEPNMARIILATEAAPRNAPIPGPFISEPYLSGLTNFHGGVNPILYLDGHVEKEPDIMRLASPPYSAHAAQDQWMPAKR